MGFKRGSWIVNRKYGIGYVSSARLGYITIKDIFSRKRLTECGKINETKFLTFSSWLAYLMDPMGEIIHAK